VSPSVCLFQFSIYVCPIWVKSHMEQNYGPQPHWSAGIWKEKTMKLRKKKNHSLTHIPSRDNIISIPKSFQTCPLNFTRLFSNCNTLVTFHLNFQVHLTSSHKSYNKIQIMHGYSAAVLNFVEIKSFFQMCLQSGCEKWLLA